MLLPASVALGALYQSAGQSAAFAFSGVCALLAAGLQDATGDAGALNRPQQSHKRLAAGRGKADTDQYLLLEFFTFTLCPMAHFI